MDILALRKDMGLSQEEFGKLIGLNSKGQVSELERGEVKPSVRVALELERLSGGRILASAINDDVALIERFRGEAA